MDEHGVRTGLRIRFSPSQRFLVSPAGDQRLGPGDNHEVRDSLRHLGGADLPAVLFNGNQLAAEAGVKTASLGIDVILDADGRDAGPFVVVDGPHHVQGIAIASVAVGDNRNADRLDHVPLNLQLLGRGDEAGVRHAFEGGRNTEPAGPNRIESGLLDQLGAERIVSSDGLDDAGTLEQDSQFGRVVHTQSTMRKCRLVVNENFCRAAKS